MTKNIGFVSTRLKGTDGVTLETEKWADVLESIGYSCHFLAGELGERFRKTGRQVPEAHFKHRVNQTINTWVYEKKQAPYQITEMILAMKDLLKREVSSFVRDRQIDVLVAENALSLPIHYPLGRALKEYIEETGIRIIGHHHDFYWEGDRLGYYGQSPLDLEPGGVFPPDSPSLAHVVINSLAQQRLRSIGIESIVVPNVMDFEGRFHKAYDSTAKDMEKKGQLFASLGLGKDDRLVLQPTRIVRRKGIELAVELLYLIGDKRNKLVIPHEAGDEGLEYKKYIMDYARKRGVRVILASRLVKSPSLFTSGKDLPFTLGDFYASSDAVTFPSRWEGFGNALLEGTYFRKPLIVNRYQVLEKDILPKGLKPVTVMDWKVREENVEKARQALDSYSPASALTDKNAKVAEKNFSYSTLYRGLKRLGL